MYELLKKLRLTKCAGFPKKFDAGPKGELTRDVKQLRDRRRETRERKCPFTAVSRGARVILTYKREERELREMSK